MILCFYKFGVFVDDFEEDLSWDDEQTIPTERTEVQKETQKLLIWVRASNSHI